MNDIVSWAWFIGGILLIAAEVQFPHFYSLFFGAGALIIAALHWMGLLTAPIPSIFAWVIISTILLVSLRRLAAKRLHSESTYQLTDEDIDAIGTIVDVVTDVNNTDNQGRIRFRGTTWPATSNHGSIPAGTKAKILYRDCLVWRVEAYHELETSEEKNRLSPPVIRSGESSN